MSYAARGPGVPEIDAKANGAELRAHRVSSMSGVLVKAFA